MLVLTFDAFCGEKQTGTLKLQLANSVSRLTLFGTKYLAYTLLVCLTFLLGIIISLITISLASSFQIALPSPGQILAVILTGLVYLSVFILLGLWFSSVAGKPSTSLACALFTWIMLVIFIPSGMAMLGEKIRTLPSEFEHLQQLNATEREIWDNAPQKAQSYGPPRAWGGKVYPYMELRKEVIDAMDAVRNQYRVTRFNDQLQQVKTALRLGRISPYVVFRSIAENIARNGLRDFEQDFDQVVSYRRMFREFIESKDREDPGSYHFVNSWHPETYSSAPVNPEEIPALSESVKKPLDVLVDSAPDILLLLLFNLVFLAGGWTGFLRCDVR
jgi:ABC-2 type transport system permease protein